MVWLLQQLVRVSSSYYSFVSGVMIALAVNLYTGVYAADQLPARSDAILWAAFLSAVSSVGWMVFSLRCEPIQRTAEMRTPTGIDRTQTYGTLLNGKVAGLATYLFIGLAFAVAALVVLGVS